MKSSILAFASSAAIAAFAGSAPVITPSSVNISQSSPRKPVVLTYYVDKPAVVTVAFYNDGVEMPANLFTNLTGDVNRKVAAGNHTITWNPVPTWPDNSTTGKTFSAKITAWATNCPPDYMVVDLRDLDKKTHFEYYTSTNWLPGTLEDKRYRTTHMVMRKIPAANKSFWMGSQSGEWGRSPDWTPSEYMYDSRRENRHRAHLTNDFYMCIYPLTYRQHLYPSNYNFNYPLYAHYSNPGDFYTEGECWELPMCGVSYSSLREVGGDFKYWPKDGHDVQVSSSVNSGLIGRKWRLLWGVDFDLPTEAQWEFACRAGTSAAVYLDGDTISSTPSTNSLDKVAWYLDCWVVGVDKSSSPPANPVDREYLPQRVGLKQPNAFGLYDMLGNVWEWCLDATVPADDYPTASPDAISDPPGLDVETNDNTVCRVLKGGSFLSPGYMCRASERVYLRQTYGDCPWAWPITGTNAIRNKSAGYRLVCPAIAVR